MMPKANTSRHAPEEIDAYLSDLPDDIRSATERVRSIIRETVPGCGEDLRGVKVAGATILLILENSLASDLIVRIVRERNVEVGIA